MDLQVLKDELDIDPLTRGYSGMTDEEAATDLNIIYRDAEGGVSGMANYVSRNRSRTNTGSDTVATAIYGRLKAVAEAQPATDPFGIGGTYEVSMPHIHAAQMFIFVISSPHIGTLDWLNNEVTAMLDLLSGGSGNARVWKSADVAAIKALSQNQQSRGQELGIGKVKTGNVEEVRRLP